MTTDAALRDHLVRALDWTEAHAGIERAVGGFPPAGRGARPPGFEHSAWQLLEHLRIAQEDLLDFCLNPRYVHDRTWPDDYWPAAPAPPSEAAWDESVASFMRTREAVKTLVREAQDLTALVPTGEGSQTYLRAILLVIDHNAYHAGQLVAVRRALGLWP